MNSQYKPIHIQCIDGKCNYSAQKHLETMSCSKKDDYNMELHGAKVTGYNRFHNLGIPVMLLQTASHTHDEPLYEVEEDEESTMFPEDKFNELLNAVQEQHTREKNITKKHRKNTKKNTQRK